jgi:transcriptional regulator with GAF, ATPase, and Fis domain
MSIDLPLQAEAGGLVQHDDIQPVSGTQPVSATANGADASEMVSLSHLVHSVDRLGGMVVRSAQVRKVLKSVSQLSPYKATVLISGESGTGKELIARALHTLGPVPNGPFVTLNCSNLVEALAESQLFGHVRGAFTDARDESQGYFRSANGGTLFLDEIGELPLKLQPKLLRSVETHEVQPVGSSHCYKVNLRLVAATNRDLRAMVKAGTFRDDLYFRMSAAAIFIPPYANDARRSRHSSDISSNNIIGCSPKTSRIYPAPPSTFYALINGREMSANSPTQSKAP